jgi:hypothetical protein
MAQIFAFALLSWTGEINMADFLWQVRKNFMGFFKKIEMFILLLSLVILLYFVVFVVSY